MLELHAPQLMECQLGKSMLQRAHLVLHGQLIGPQMAHILVVMVQQGNGWARAVIQELHAQHLQLIDSDVEGFMEAH